MFTYVPNPMTQLTPNHPIQHSKNRPIALVYDMDVKKTTRQALGIAWEVAKRLMVLAYRLVVDVIVLHTQFRNLIERNVFTIPVAVSK